MHCIGELMLPMPRCRGSSIGRSTPRLASCTAAIIRSDPIAMMRRTSGRGFLLAQLPLAVGEHRLDDVAAEVRVARAPRRDAWRPLSVVQMTWSV